MQKDLTSNINLYIPFSTNDGLHLELEEEIIDYVIKTSDGQKISSNNNIKHYRGIVKDNPNSLVSLTFGEDETLGLIITDEGNFNLSLTEQLNEYILYDDNNLKRKLDFTCGTDDDSSIQYDAVVLRQKLKTSINSNNLTSKTVRLYLETEFDIFQTRGSISSVETFIAGMYNQVALLYQNENIITALTELFIWNTQDPYTSTSTNGLLNQFQTQRTFFNGDLGQLLTFRNIGGGQAAGFSGLCNINTSQKLAVSMLYNTFLNAPIYSWSVYVITHEFGHLFGSRHTHACAWNGNNTAIDGCAGVTEGGCPTPSIPSNGGTIMSYCHLLSVGINFNIGFGLQPGNIIRNSVNNANCLLSINGPNLICDQATYTLGGFHNLPEEATVEWSVNRNLRIVSGQGTSSVVVSKWMLGYSQNNRVTAEIILPLNRLIITKKNIESGSANPAILLSPLTGPTPGPHVEYGVIGRRYWLHAYGINLSNNDADYNWKFYSSDPFELPVHGVGRQIEYSKNIPGDYKVSLKYNGECGWTDEVFRIIRFE